MKWARCLESGSLLDPTSRKYICDIPRHLLIEFQRRGTHVHTAWVKASLIGKPNSGEVVWETLLALYLSTCTVPFSTILLHFTTQPAFSDKVEHQFQQISYGSDPHSWRIGEPLSQSLLPPISVQASTPH